MSGVEARGDLHLDVSSETGPGPSYLSECDCDTIPVPRCHLVWRPCSSPLSMIYLPLSFPLFPIPWRPYSFNVVQRAVDHKLAFLS